MCKELIINLSMMRMKKGKKGEGKQEKSKTFQSEANLVEVWEVALSLCDERQCCGRRTTKKY